MIELTTYDDNELLVFLSETEPLNQKAFEVLWYRYSKRLRQYCFLKKGNKEEAEDLFQDTWVEFYKATQKSIQINSIKNYLLSTAYFLNCKMLKSNKLKFKTISTFDYDKFIDNSVNFEEHYENQEVLLHFYLALNILDEVSKECVILRWTGELSYKEIAKVLDDTPEAIRKRCCRAMDKIINYLDSFNKG